MKVPGIPVLIELGKYFLIVRIALKWSKLPGYCSLLGEQILDLIAWVIANPQFG